MRVPKALIFVPYINPKSKNYTIFESKFLEYIYFFLAIHFETT